MEQLSPELLSQVVARLVAAVNPLKMYLFGSCASGNAHAESDLDLLVVVTNDAPSTYELAKKAYPSLRGIKTAVELHFVHERDLAKWANVERSLPYDAIQKGRVIYAAPASARATVA